jgi:hypothetical protein
MRILTGSGLRVKLLVLQAPLSLHRGRLSTDILLAF